MWWMSSSDCSIDGWMYFRMIFTTAISLSHHAVTVWSFDNYRIDLRQSTSRSRDIRYVIAGRFVLWSDRCLHLDLLGSHSMLPVCTWHGCSIGIHKMLKLILKNGSYPMDIYTDSNSKIIGSWSSTFPFPLVVNRAFLASLEAFVCKGYDCC